MKTAVSIPDHVFRSAERLAARLGVSRSELYARALAAMVEKQDDELVTDRLNAVYGPEGEGSELAPEVAELRSRSLPREQSTASTKVASARPSPR